MTNQTQKIIEEKECNHKGFEAYNKETLKLYCKKCGKIEGELIMPNPIQKIIEKAKALGYLPEKKKIPNKKKDWSSNDYDWHFRNELGFNQALSEIQLEKVIELAYEKGRELAIKEVEGIIEKHFNEVEKEFGDSARVGVSNLLGLLTKL